MEAMGASTAEKKIYLTENQVAARTGIASSTLQKQRYKGVGIPYYRIGRTIRYLNEDVETFMEKYRVETLPE